MAEKKILGYDATGFNLVTEATRVLLNQFPDLQGESIRYEELSEDSGIAFSSDNGALVINEIHSITDHFFQNCQFPFYVVYRTSSKREGQKLDVQKFLDTLGKWLCKEKVMINGVEHRLENYPKLSEGRTIKRITRANSYGLEPSNDGVQDWLLPVTIEYTNEFDL